MSRAASTANRLRMTEQDIAAWRQQEFDVQQLAVRCEQISTANGFEPTTWENLPAYLMFIVTEVDEALHAPTRDAFREEIADIAIRLLVHLNALWFQTWSLRRAPQTTPSSWPFTGLHQLAVHPDIGLRLVINRVAEAAKLWRSGRAARDIDVRICLEQAFGQVFSVAGMCGIDLLLQIDRKCAGNAARPRLHGRVEVIG